VAAAPDFPAAELEAVLGARAARVSVEPLPHGPPAATAGLWRVEADDQRLVLKVLHADPDGHPRWPAAHNPDHPYYWRREALAYESGLLERLSGGLRAPHLRGCFDREDSSVAVWLEQVEDPPAREWTLDRYGLAARHLGRAQGSPAAGLPDDPWLSRRWLRAYLDLRAHEIETHLEPATRPVWEARDALLARLEAGPQTLCHLDFHPGNLFGGESETVVVDWAYCGLGALGEDAGNLVPDTLLDGFVAADRGAELEQVVWEGYLAGLADAGWSGDERSVRYAFAAGAGLKYVWIRARLASGVEPETATRWRHVLPLLDELAEEALRLASEA